MQAIERIDQILRAMDLLGRPATVAEIAVRQASLCQHAEERMSQATVRRYLHDMAKRGWLKTSVDSSNGLKYLFEKSKTICNV